MAEDDGLLLNLAGTNVEAPLQRVRESKNKWTRRLERRSTGAVRAITGLFKVVTYILPVEPKFCVNMMA